MHTDLFPMREDSAYAAETFCIPDKLIQAGAEAHKDPPNGGTVKGIYQE